MKIRWIYIIHSAVALMVGGCLYLFFREHTYLHRIIGGTFPSFADVQFFGVVFLRYYLPDFLWSYSLYCGLCGIICPTGHRWIWPAISALGLGVVWELAQYFSWVSGTGDVADVLLYGAAIAVAEIIFRRKRQNV